MTNEIHRKSLFQSAASSMGCISSQMVSFDQMAIRRIGLGVSNKISKLTLKGLFNLCSDNTTLYNNSKVCIRTTRHVSRLQNLFYWEKILKKNESFYDKVYAQFMHLQIMCTVPSSRSFSNFALHVRSRGPNVKRKNIAHRGICDILRTSLCQD